MTNHTCGNIFYTSNNMDRTSSLKSAMKQPRRASLTSKYPRSIDVAISICETPCCDSGNGVQVETRASQCRTAVSFALDVLTADEQDGQRDHVQSSTITSATTPVSSSTTCTSAESTYGYDDLDVSMTKGTSSSSRRRYARRCSVTEFSLKAAVMAQVQLARDLQLARGLHTRR